jgi:hypothetical protein
MMRTSKSPHRPVIVTAAQTGDAAA